MYVTLLPTGKKLHHNSSFFREPYVFEYLPKYINERFPKAKYPDGININLGACAKGEDAWSLAMTLESARELTDHTIHASDINRGVVNLARTGILSFLPRTLEKAEEVIPNITDFFDSTPDEDPTDPTREKILLTYKKYLSDADLKRKVSSGNSGHYINVDPQQVRTSMLYRVSEDLRSYITFRTIDFQKEFSTERFKKPCLVIFRNALQHFNSEERSNFANALYNVLKPGSSLVIGAGDIVKRVPVKLIDAGFEPLNLTYDRNYYQHQSSLLAKTKDPTAHIFEKN